MNVTRRLRHTRTHTHTTYWRLQVTAVVNMKCSNALLTIHSRFKTSLFLSRTLRSRLSLAQAYLEI